MHGTITPQDAAGAQGPVIVHASCAAVAGRGVLVLGPSGAGKSSLVLEMLSRGAGLVADDRVILSRETDALIAASPPPLEGLIEARGIGILKARYGGPTKVSMVVDLGKDELERLPPQRSTILLGVSLPLLHNTGTAAFAAAILQYLREGRSA
ncbi:HPr kinase/phosphorylase [Pseudooceanicola sediminis]|uniref:HPr kinase/phosphorylase n=1 Tax=Pseudooceanicola sediminis TaxID=2211117 RepID=UPI001F2A06B6|nr:HPr kinase/phosphatase C-terminal domain-containing protein [Pseudooceanicola sediminis]